MPDICDSAGCQNFFQGNQSITITLKKWNCSDSLFFPCYLIDFHERFLWLRLQLGFWLVVQIIYIKMKCRVHAVSLDFSFRLITGICIIIFRHVYNNWGRILNKSHPIHNAACDKAAKVVARAHRWKDQRSLQYKTRGCRSQPFLKFPAHTYGSVKIKNLQSSMSRRRSRTKKRLRPQKGRLRQPWKN